jgi:flagellar protein FlaG
MEITPINGADSVSRVHSATPSPDQVAQNRQILQAMKTVNTVKSLGESRELRFMMDRSTHRPIIQIVDLETDEVIGQIPAEHVLKLAESLR